MRELFSASPPGRALLSDLLVDQLVDAGITTTFGVPGGPVSPFFVAAKRRNMRLVESKHESSAMFEAIAYATATGEIPLVLVTSGPGVTNVLTGLATAHERRVPLLLLAGDVPWERDDRELIQKSDFFEQLVKAFARETLRVRSVRGARGVFAKALGSLQSSHADGPVAIICPIDIGAASGEAVDACQRMRLVSSRSADRNGAMSTLIERANRSTQPVLVLGRGCAAHADTIMTRIVEPAALPFVTTVQGKGLFDETHPLSLGHIGLAASAWAQEYCKGADFVLALGTDLDDCSIGSVCFSNDAFVAHVDRDSEVLGKSLPTDLAFVLSLESFFGSWIEHAQELAPSARAERLADFKRTSPRWLDRRSSSGSVCPQRFIRKIDELFFAERSRFRLVSDIGEHMLFALHYFTSRGGGDFEVFLAHGSMGSGIAAAIGFAIADPTRPVVCVCGDGGMQMNGMELLLAQKLKLPMIYAVFNDARYNMVHHGSSTLYGEELSWETCSVDFAAWARSMGMHGIRIDRIEQMDEIDWDPLLTAGPCVLDVRIDRSVKMGGGRNDMLRHMSLGQAK